MNVKARKISDREVVASAVGGDFDEVEAYQQHPYSAAKRLWQYEGKAYYVGPRPPVEEGWTLLTPQPTWLGIAPTRLVWEENA